MSLARHCCWIAFVGCLLATSPATAGWSIWPFQDRDELPKQPPPTRQMTGAGSRTYGEVLDNNDPSVFSRLTAGPNRLMNSTKQALSLGNSKKPAQPKWTSNSAKKKKSNSSSWFGWMRPSNPEPPRTIGEWFELDRPQ
jgi:hypothetical protein